MEFKNNEELVPCPKCSSNEVEKLEAKENVHGIFGFYFRGSLDKEFFCKKCRHSW